MMITEKFLIDHLGVERLVGFRASTYILKVLRWKKRQKQGAEDLFAQDTILFNRMTVLCHIKERNA